MPSVNSGGIFLIPGICFWCRCLWRLVLCTLQSLPNFVTIDKMVSPHSHYVMVVAWNAIVVAGFNSFVII